MVMQALLSCFVPRVLYSHTFDFRYTPQFPSLFRWRKPCLNFTYAEEDEEEVSSCGKTLRHGFLKVFITEVHIRYCGRIRGPRVGKLQ